MHDGLVGILVSILKDVGVPGMAVVTEAKGLRATRPGDIVVLDFFAEGRHLVIDTVVTTVYRNTNIRHAASIPGYVAKQAEDRNFLADRALTQPVAAIHGCPHIMVPFAIENIGRIEAHVLALLRALANVALVKGGRPSLCLKGSGAVGSCARVPMGLALVATHVHQAVFSHL